VGNGSGVSRGDRNRNARLGRLRGQVPVENAIVGIDLADRKQMVVVCDHDSKVLARKTQWGIVQVRVTVDARRIVDVRALRLPHSNPLDVQLSGRAVRVLRPAVLAAQSADVDMVSQATVTSDGYLRSLQSALDELHA
jgi:hypothetical protein